MSLLSGNLGRVNAIFLLLVTPIVVRFWIEAVVWRLERGRQMLGFSLIHGGAGWMTVPLLLSFAVIWIYALWVIVVIVLWAFPGPRRKMANPQRAVLGGVSVFLFFEIADFLQREISMGVVLIGAAAMTALACVIGWLIYAGFRRQSYPSARAERNS
jgi:hypothetical protein